MNPPVLVVGAGPVGLTAANCLARFHVPVRIIDSSDRPSKLSKALVIWRRSLHTLDGLIPYEQWLQHGRPVGGVGLADSGAIFAAMDLQQPAYATAAPAPCQHMMPAGVLHTQAQIEAELEQHLQDSYGITVERSTKLDSFTVDEATGNIHCVLAPTSAQPDPAGIVTVNSSSAAAAHSEVVASYLIGCDGARSTVRKGLGVPFPGFSDPGNRFLLMDCTYEHEPGINSNKPGKEAEGLPPPDRIMASTTAVGLVGVIPLVDVPNAVRLVWNAGPDGPAQPTLAEFQSVLMSNTRLQIKLKQVLWQSEFSVNERQVGSYVHHGGRVLLAGDAAHVHSPAGGQGMNTGIQDATNLAWKVALAAVGDVASAPELLQTYQEERHSVGQDAVRFSGALLRANTIRSPIARFVRRVVLGVLTRIPSVRQMFISTTAEDTVSYTNCSLAKAVPAQAGPNTSSTRSARCAGKAFPDLSVSVGGTMRPATDLLRGGEGCFGTLVLLTVAESPASNTNVGAEGSSSAQAATGWPTHWGHWPLHVVSVARQGGTGNAVGNGSPQAVDKWGLLSQAVGGADGVLVRPDGVIAAAGGPEVVAGWLQAHGMVENL